MCVAGFLCSSSALWFHSVLRQRPYSLTLSFERPTDLQLLSPSDPGSDTAFYAHCRFVLVACFNVWASCSSLCVTILFDYHVTVPNALQMKRTHVHNHLLMCPLRQKSILYMCHLYSPYSGWVSCKSGGFRRDSSQMCCGQIWEQTNCP